MKKFKVLMDNIFIYGFGSVVGKIIPFLMLPIITRLMPNPSYYALNDLSATLTSVCQAVAVFGMYDAMFRLFFDKADKEYQRQVCSTALAITVITSIGVFLAVCLFSRGLAARIFGDVDYLYLVFLAAFSILVGSTNNIVAAPTKLQNKSKEYIFINTVFPIISYAIAIPLLCMGHYSSALQLSGLIASIMVEVFFICRNRGWFSFSDIRLQYVKPLLKIAVPLMPSFLIYWVYNSSDRLMIKYFLDAHEVGIYAIGAKMGQVSNLIYVAFTGGWGYFAYSTMTEENQVKNYSKIFEVIGMLTFVCSIIMCAGSFLFYKLLFTDEYLMGYKVAPYLFCAPLLQMLFQIAGNQFMIMKKSWPGVFMLGIGAIVNVVLNIMLIPRIGIEGAGIATIIGYLTADFICIAVLLAIKRIVLSGRFVAAAFLTVAYFILWATVMHKQFVMGVVIAVGMILFFFYLYRQEICQFIQLVKQMEHEKRGI